VDIKYADIGWRSFSLLRCRSAIVAANPVCVSVPDLGKLWSSLACATGRFGPSAGEWGRAKNFASSLRCIRRSKSPGPYIRDAHFRVAPSAAPASLRSLPRYLPWLRRDALHSSAPGTTRVTRL